MTEIILTLIGLALLLIVLGTLLLVIASRINDTSGDETIDEHVADIPRVPPQIDFRNTNFFRD